MNSQDGTRGPASLSLWKWLKIATTQSQFSRPPCRSRWVERASARCATSSRRCGTLTPRGERRRRDLARAREQDRDGLENGDFSIQRGAADEHAAAYMVAPSRFLPSTLGTVERADGPGTLRTVLAVGLDIIDAMPVSRDVQSHDFQQHL